MKTLLFCTSWSDSHIVWKYRYDKWLSYHKNSGLYFNKILMVDDASPIEPNNFTFAKIDPINLPDLENSEPVLFASYSNQLGRLSVLNYPGWWRSFGFAINYAHKYGYEKIIHIESDTFLLTDRIQSYVNDLSDGWTAFWCPRWKFPETCIQVIAGSSIKNALEITTLNYEKYVGKPVEKIFPFSKVEQGFIGDRYGEYMIDIPLNADYCSQTPIDHAVVSAGNRRIKRAVCFFEDLTWVSENQIIFNTLSWVVDRGRFDDFLTEKNCDEYDGIQISIQYINMDRVKIISEQLSRLDKGGVFYLEAFNEFDQLINNSFFLNLNEDFDCYAQVKTGSHFKFIGIKKSANRENSLAKLKRICSLL